MNSPIYYFGYLLGRLEANRDKYSAYTFDEFLCDIAEYKCDNIVFTDEMFQRVMECYCSDVKLVNYKDKTYALVKDSSYSTVYITFVNVNENRIETLEDKMLEKKIKQEFDIEQDEEEDEEEDEEQQTVIVKRFNIDGKRYLKASDNTLYDEKTHEEVGVWDAETNTIKQLSSDK